MKLRILTAAALFAITMALSGCGCTNNGTMENTTTSASTTTPAPVTTTPEDTDGNDNGTYEADDNGDVEDDKDGTQTEKSDVTDSGIVEEDVTTDNADVTDEAAFASSYIDRTKIGWGLGKERDNKNRPVDAINAEEKYSPLGAHFLAPENKICLTFDVGYENGCTERILDTLKEKNVKAVFFLTYDYCKSNIPIVERMIKEGHTLGNHTYSHPSIPSCTDSEITEEITLLHDYVKDTFGYEMTLFRYPMGEFSKHSLSLIKDLGYTSLFWSFAYADWDTKSQPDPAEAYAKIKDSTHSGIYLLHAVSETNAEILGNVLDYWKSEGYFVGTDFGN